MADNKTQIIITAKDETRAAIASAQQGLQSLTTGAASLGLQLGALGGVASLGGIGLMAKQAIDAADNLGKMAQKVGVSVESLSALEYAGKLSDVSLEQLGTGLKKLSVNLNEVGSGGDNDAAAALKALGISATDSSGKLRNADAVFADVAEAFAGMKDGAGKTALAVAIFGKAGADLIPMLNAGAKGLEDMKNEATALGLVFGGDMAKQAEAFNDDLTRMGESARGLGVTVAGAVLPALSEMARSFVDASKESSGFAQGLSTVVKLGLETVAVLGREVGFVFEVAGNNVAALAAALQALSSGNFSGVAAIGEAWVENIKKARAEADAFGERIINPFVFVGPPAPDTRSDAPVTGGGKGGKGGAGKKEKELSAEDMAYGGYKGAYKDFVDAIKRATDDAAAAADADVQIEKDKQDRIMAVVRETYDGKLAVLQKELQAAAQLLDEGMINEDQWAEYANVRIEAFAKVKDEGVEAFKELERAIEGWGKASADAFVEFAFTGKGSFSDMVQSILKDMAKMIVYQNVMKPMASSISDSIGSSGGIGGFFSSLFGGGRANGGPVNPGQYYVVGENGPEILVPNSSGTVIPNGGGMGGGGSTSVVINIDASGTKTEGDAGNARELGRRIESAVRSVLMVEQRPGGMLA